MRTIINNNGKVFFTYKLPFPLYVHFFFTVFYACLLLLLLGDDIEREEFVVVVVVCFMLYALCSVLCYHRAYIIFNDIALFFSSVFFCGGGVEKLCFNHARKKRDFWLPKEKLLLLFLLIFFSFLFLCC